jgi:hypothetical protein
MAVFGGVVPGVGGGMLAVLLDGVGCAGGVEAVEPRLAVAELPKPGPPNVGVRPPAILKPPLPGAALAPLAPPGVAGVAPAAPVPAAAGTHGMVAGALAGVEPGWVVPAAPGPGVPGCGFAAGVAGAVWAGGFGDDGVL